MTFLHDPSRPHVCEGVPSSRVEFELRRRLNELERRIEAIEAGHGGDRRGQEPGAHPATRQTASSDEDPAPEAKPRFGRKANHRRYMREWRARQTALRSGGDPA
jgi:hypothetical protein